MSSQIRIEAEKQAMRAQARAVRQAVPPGARIRAAEMVAQTGLDFLGRAPGVIAGYYPVRSEFDGLPLLRRAAAEGWVTALPVIAGSAPLQFRRWAIAAPLQPGPFGVPEPAEGDVAVPDVLLVPLLAYDRRGHRLGYGGGHYDRTLAALRTRGRVTAIGLAFDVQEVARVPVGPDDEPLDWILTPPGAIVAKHSI